LAGVALGAEADGLAQRVGRVLGHAHQRADDLLEGHLLAGVAREDLVDDGDGADLPLYVVQGRPPQPGVQAPGSQTEQRRARLQVVLHPVVDLADGGVLRYQEAVPAAQVGHVADEGQRPGYAPLVEKRDAPQADDDVVAPLYLLVDGQDGGEGALDRRLLHAQLVEAQPLGVGGDAHAVEGADRVGGGVLHPGALVEHDHAVADTRRLLGGDVLAQERELPVDDHAGEAVEDLHVDALELARAPADAEGRLPGEHGQELASEAHGDALHARPLPPPPDPALTLDDLPEAP